MSLENTLTGLAACGVTTFFFGSMFVPIKRQDPGDGFFVQWIMCTAIFMVGMLVNVYTGFPKFCPLAMLGGTFWTIGNATAIPILQSIGLGMGVLIWGVTNCLMGWATSRFGLFGIEQNSPSNVPLNYLGLGFILLGGVLFSFVKPTPKTVADPENSLTILHPQCAVNEMVTLLEAPNSAQNSKKKRIFGTVLALVAGLFYGSTFTPVIYVQEHPEIFPDAPKQALSYVFAHFTGIFLTSSVLMIFYVLYKRNKPVLNNQVILPAYISGIMWAVAQTSWFLANGYIPQSISFPINSMMPGVIAALWSVLYFREVQGARNLKILVFAMLITISGAIMVGLSKDM